MNDCDCNKKPKCPAGMTPEVVEIVNKEAPTLFHKVPEPASKGDDKQNPPYNGKYKNVLAEYEDGGALYFYSSDGIYTPLGNGRGTDDFNELTNRPKYNGETMTGETDIPDFSSDIESLNAAIEDANTSIENLSAEIDTEVTARENADIQLQTQITTETTTREAADTQLQTSITAETTARETADSQLQTQITAVSTDLNTLDNSLASVAKTGQYSDLTGTPTIDTALSTSSTNAVTNAAITTAINQNTSDISDISVVANSAVQPEDINYTVVTDVTVDTTPSTSVVQLDNSKVNLESGTTTTTNVALPVASSTQAGVMNSATFDAISQNTNNINALMNGAVAITGLSASPSQSDLTTAWETATGIPSLMNRASIYDVDNVKVWTYYTNDTTWHSVAAAGGSVTVNQFTNTSAGTIKGSTNIGQIFAENDGTGSVNGWDALSNTVADHTSKLSGIEAGAQVNTVDSVNGQTGAVVLNATDVGALPNTTVIPTVNDATLTITQNGTSVGTFTANSSTNTTIPVTDTTYSAGTGLGLSGTTFNVDTTAIAPITYVDDEIASKAVGEYETYTIATTGWTALSGASPYTYSATVTATYTIGNDTIIELINDQAALFANYGFAIASVSGQALTIYAVDEPTASVALKVNYKEQ